MMETIIEPIRSIDWDDLDAVENGTRKALTELADNTEVIREALRSLPNRPDLLKLCEHYDILDKLVLHDDESGIRVRLHIFLPGYFDRPHNHRWTYSSLILRGEYRHYLFGDVQLDTRIDPTRLAPIQVRQEKVGDTYALHHTMVHAVVAEPYTVSLVLRGPAVKDRFLVMDRKTSESWWQYGARHEDESSAEKKRMSVGRLNEVVTSLHSWHLFK